LRKVEVSTPQDDTRAGIEKDDPMTMATVDAAESDRSVDPASLAGDGESDAVVFEVRDLSVGYSGVLAVDGVSFDVTATQITALIGPSGCGKSTLLRSFNRMNDLVPGVRTEGQVLAAGIDVFAPSTDVVDLRRRVGMVFQRPNPFPKSIFDNVSFGLRLLGIRD